MKSYLPGAVTHGTESDLSLMAVVTCSQYKFITYYVCITNNFTFWV